MLAGPWDRRAVRVEHDANVSRIYYGTYYQRPNRQTGQYQLDAMCARTTRFIRSLSLGGASPFLMARPMPVTVTRQDPPEWDLRTAPGVYSLQICYCISKPDFPDRRDGAVEIVRQLRKEGEQAYYYHGPSKSLVCVGSFGESAIIENPRRGSRRYSSEVIHFYVAKGLSQVGMHPEEDESITVEHHGFDEVVKMIEDNEIRDSKTITGVLSYLTRSTA